MSIFVRPTAVELAAVAGGDLKAMAVVQHAEMERSDADVRRREIYGMKPTGWRWTQRFMGLGRSDLDRQLLTGKHAHTTLNIDLNCLILTTSIDSVWLASTTATINPDDASIKLS